MCDKVKEINSHIQLPKCVLKQFQGNGGKVFYLDLNQNRILLRSAKDIGTEKGYFSKEMEDFLGELIETPLGIYRTKIKSEIEKKDDYITIPSNTEEKFREYIIAAIARSNIALDEFYKKSITASVVSDQENHDDTVRIMLRKGNRFYEYFKAWKMGILENESLVEFVVPRNCFYFVSMFGQPIIIAPMTPKMAIMLLDSKPDGKSKRLIHSVTYIVEETIIKQLNEKALYQEYVFNKSFVAGTSKAELERLQQVLKSERNEYEQAWRESRND